MLKPGDVLDYGPLGMRFEIKKTAESTGGESLEIEWEMAPRSGGTPVHIHPHAIETYEVLEGKFDVYLNGAWKTLSRGERVVAEKGVPHTFRNSTDASTRIYNTHQPAMRFGEYFEGLHRLVDRGVIQSDKMTPKAILHLALLMTSHGDEIQSVKPPAFVMELFASLGRLLRYRI